MQIQYYLADGQEIEYETLGPVPTMEDTNAVALAYAKKRPQCLPEYLFISVRIYVDFMANYYANTVVHDPVMQTMCMVINTSVGPLKVKVMPFASDAKMFIVGNMDDFERYDIDKIFEKIVLKDCERDT